MNEKQKKRTLDWHARAKLAKRWYQIDRLHCAQAGAVFVPLLRIPRDAVGFYELKGMDFGQLIRIEQYHRAMVRRRLEDLAAGRPV